MKEKSVIIFLQIVFFCSLLNSCRQAIEEQELIYFPEGTSWKEIMTDPFYPQFYKIFQFTVKGDTIIKGNNFQKVFVNGKLQPVFYLSERGDKIYYYDNSLSQVLLAYDFKWEIGMPISVFCVEEQKFHIVDSIREIHKIRLEDYKVYEYIKFPDHYYIKTIGYINQPLFPYLMHYEKIGYNINILNFERNRCEIYRDHTFDSYWE